MRNSKTEDRINDKMDRVVDKFDDSIESAKSNIKNKVDHYAGVGMADAEAARDSFAHLTENITHRVEEAVKTGISRVKASSEDAREIVKKYPLYTVAGAIAISFMAGMICGKVSSRRD